MKIYTLLFLCAICACQSPAPVTPPSVDTSYYETKLHLATFPVNGGSSCIYFSDSVGGVSCEFYTLSGLGLIDSLRTPANVEQLTKVLPQQLTALFVNGQEVKLKAPVKEAFIQLPAYLGMYTLDDKKYLVLKMYTVPDGPGDDWYSIALPVDDLQQQYVFETQHEVTTAALKEKLKAGK